jgi:hypothetical protein
MKKLVLLALLAMPPLAFANGGGNTHVLAANGGGNTHVLSLWFLMF